MEHDRSLGEKWLLIQIILSELNADKKYMKVKQVAQPDNIELTEVFSSLLRKTKGGNQ